MALRCTVSALKRPEEVRKPQQGLAARFKLCGRKPLRGLPPSPRWTWRCASREANVRNGLDAYARRRGTYLSPNASANAFRRVVLWRDDTGATAGRERDLEQLPRLRLCSHQVRRPHTRQAAHQPGRSSRRRRLSSTTSSTVYHTGIPTQNPPAPRAGSLARARPAPGPTRQRIPRHYLPISH